MRYIFQIAKGAKKVVKYGSFVLVLINTVKYFAEECEKINDGYD